MNPIYSRVYINSFTKWFLQYELYFIANYADSYRHHVMCMCKFIYLYHQSSFSLMFHFPLPKKFHMEYGWLGSLRMIPILGSYSSVLINLNLETNQILKLVLVATQSFTGCVQIDQPNKETDLLKNNNDLIYASVDKTPGGTEPPVIPFGLKGSNINVQNLRLLIFPSTCEGVSEALRPASEALLHDIPFVGKDSVVVQEISYNEIIAKGSSVVTGIQSKQEQVENRLYNQGAGDIPKYVNLEPSLAMDWLEISWDELRIKERIGAGKLSVSHALQF